MENAGKDTSKLFKTFHSEEVLKKYHDKLCIGRVANYKKREPYVLYSQPIWEQRFHSPYYNHSHREFLARVKKFVKEEIIPTLSDWKDKDERPRELLLKMGREGKFINFKKRFNITHLISFNWQK